jgi:hypothetical protein
MRSGFTANLLAFSSQSAGESPSFSFLFNQRKKIYTCYKAASLNKTLTKILSILRQVSKRHQARLGSKYNLIELMIEENLPFDQGWINLLKKITSFL